MRRILIASVALAASATLALAQSNPVYVQFTPSAVKGALYKTDAGPAPRVAILITHRTSNFLAHLGTRELAKRGFLVLGMNPRFDNNEAAVTWEDIALDIRSGVEFLKKQPGIAKVVLVGHSGGGPATTFYQAVAEKGPTYCQGSGKLVQCDGKELAGLPSADGIVLVDAHPGNPVNVLRSINPAVLNEGDATRIDPDLDPFNPKNGFNPAGPSTYSETFKQKYFKAQAARMNRLIETAREKLKRDDDAFLIVRGEGARLMELDPAVHHSTVKPQKLLKNDGTVAMQIVESVRRPARGAPDENAKFSSTRLLTLRSFLSANAIRSTDSMDGIDDCSSNNSTPCALRSISVPLLITAMGAHYFIRDNEIHYEVAASKDKEFVVIEGATHGITPCMACETTRGQYSASVKNFFDYVQKWINARFALKT
jgi:pimeloyl-ACP methyl ester carboxylesterase